jgi:hypothetical protein
MKYFARVVKSFLQEPASLVYVMRYRAQRFNLKRDVTLAQGFAGAQLFSKMRVGIIGHVDGGVGWQPLLTSVSSPKFSQVRVN